MQKIFDWNPLKEKYSIDPILKSFQRGYRYYEMLTLLNVDPNLKIDLSKKIFDWNPLKEKYSIDPILKSFQRGYRYYEMLTLLNVDPNLKIDLCKKYSIGIL